MDVMPIFHNHCLGYRHNFALFYQLLDIICSPSVLFAILREASSGTYGPWVCFPSYQFPIYYFDNLYFLIYKQKIPKIFTLSFVQFHLSLLDPSMQTRLRDLADFSPCSAVIFMPCKLVATERSMLILRYFSKDVLNIWLCSIHLCPWLQLWSSLACHFRALLLLQNVSWQIVYMLFNFAKVVVVDPCML